MSRRTMTALAIGMCVFLVVPAWAAWASWVTGQHAQAVFNVFMFLVLAAGAVVMIVCRPPKDTR